MRVERYICDVCKDKDAKFYFKEDCGHEMDPSGNGYNTNWEFYDVCEECMLEFVRKNKNVEII